jgi:hypothetical protein
MRVAWQDTIPLDALIGSHPIRQIVVTARPRRTQVDVAWVVVPEGSWTTAEPQLAEPSATTHPFPSGSPENRAAERTRERKRVEKMWQDRMLFTSLMGWTDWSRYAGHHVAKPHNGDPTRVALGVIP